MADLKRSAKCPAKSTVPRKLDKTKLFRLDVDDEIWYDCGNLSSEAQEEARWLGDPDVRKGILALLQRDRCLEEQERIDQECQSMSSWLRETKEKLEAAIASEAGKWILFAQTVAHAFAHLGSQRRSSISDQT